MAFWSGEKLALQLPALITPFDTSRIDCAAYTLSVGHNIFVTADNSPSASVTQGVRVTLSPKQQFIIPAGQFAFLHTDEIVRVPNNAIAFISIKASQKFKGLVNVSGFHVDPGWNGQLVFSVYNAGPAPVHLEQAMNLFLIWYCDLDQESSKVKDMPNPRLGLPNELMANMSGQVFSPMALGGQFQHLARDVDALRSEVRRFGSLFRWSAGIVMSFVIAFSIAVFQLIGEPVRDFLLTEWKEHTSKPKVEYPIDKSSQLVTPSQPSISSNKELSEQNPSQTKPTDPIISPRSQNEPEAKITPESRPPQSNPSIKPNEGKGPQKP